LDESDVPERASLAVLDLSFISVRLVLASVLNVLAPGAWIVVLVKPQFEAGRGEVPRGGVVRSEETRQRVLGEVETFGKTLGLESLGAIPSPIAGAKGNREFLLVFRVN